jgi:predicted acetyltransferase
MGGIIMSQANNIVAILTLVINDFDPEQLLAGGAPLDEYSSEIRQIADFDIKHLSEVELAVVIRDIFSKMFSSDYKLDYCTKLAKTIKETLADAERCAEQQHTVELVKVAEEQKSVLRQLIELYEYDFSEFNDADVNQHGLYGYTYFDHYWTESKRSPYFIKVNGQYAGFVLVNDYCYILKEEARAIGEFFIMRKYRRRGIGQRAARLIFDTYHGPWEVLQHGNNEASKSFWLKAITDYTDGNYEVCGVVTESWKGQGIIFNVTKA